MKRYTSSHTDRCGFRIHQKIGGRQHETTNSLFSLSCVLLSALEYMAHNGTLHTASIELNASNASRSMYLLTLFTFKLTLDRFTLRWTLYLLQLNRRQTQIVHSSRKRRQKKHRNDWASTTNINGLLFYCISHFLSYLYFFIYSITLLFYFSVARRTWCACACVLACNRTMTLFHSTLDFDVWWIMVFKPMQRNLRILSPVAKLNIYFIPIHVDHVRDATIFVNLGFCVCTFCRYIVATCIIL